MKNILRSITRTEYIPEELILEFSQKSIQIIQERKTDGLSKDFRNFANYMELFWRGKKYNSEDSAEKIYQMGQLLAYTTILNELIEIREKEIVLEEHVELLKTRFEVFDTVKKNRGITHKTLAERSGMSASALSQFINKVNGAGFFNYRIMGREKHYYLTRYGEKIYDTYIKKCNSIPKSYEKVINLFNSLEEQLENDSKPLILIESKENMMTKRLYEMRENEEKKATELLNISINKDVLYPNKEEISWKISKNTLQNA